jgi:hypothetical protein
MKDQKRRVAAARFMARVWRCRCRSRLSRTRRGRQILRPLTACVPDVDRRCAACSVYGVHCAAIDQESAPFRRASSGIRQGANRVTSEGWFRWPLSTREDGTWRSSVVIRNASVPSSSARLPTIPRHRFRSKSDCGSSVRIAGVGASTGRLMCGAFRRRKGPEPPGCSRREAIRPAGQRRSDRPLP